MAVIADGGALADAGLVVNICIAVGTIGAATVALWLGVQAQRTSLAQNREARLKLTRQVVCLYHAGSRRINGSVEIVNGSPEVVTNLLPWVRLPNQSGPGAPTWEWGNERTEPRSEVRYLLPGTGEVLHGAFRSPLKPDNADATAQRGWVAVPPGNVEIVLTWQDSYGEVWSRRNGGEPFPSSYAKPGRDERDFLPNYLQPAHWPPKATSHPRVPLRERLRLWRVRRGIRLSRAETK